MHRDLPPLNAVRAFEASARNESFTRAAGELLVSQGAVSRHIATLEQWLQVRLFTRVHRGIELTPQGRAFFQIVKSALDLIESGAGQLKHSPDERRLRLKLPPTFAIRWLIPRLVRFHAMHPRVDVQITTSHERCDFDREDIDVSIYSWPEPPTGPGHRCVFGEVLLPVCAPGLLERAAPLREPADLANHVLLCSLNRPQDWPTWLAAAQVSNVDGNRGLKFENAALAIQAAADGLGVVITQWAFVEDDLASGRLVAPLSLRAPTRRAYVMSTDPNRVKPARVEAFEEWIDSEAGEVVRRLGLPAAERPPAVRLAGLTS
ncbi:transcriptional regulator GcvA [Xanthobacteraceae bacterium Astr-EGSB]|uniref:transcriptional regulator GcvA n=1 Tax=Astrobacterium formosum TaxID=3069710 RepID=UPI0027AE1B84|nr:transcriptional regulator GcvA [Xanthobacteraceae bacterium Astr-EGSB]